METIKTIKGINDIIYPDSARWKRIIDIMENIFESYGYRKIFLPVIEYTELFTRSIGEDTDIVAKEMYTFKDRKGRDLSLRPEGTAGVVRAMIQNKLLQGNIREKVYYFGPMFRYENPQDSRYRQFYQLGCEVYGSNSPEIDAEITEIAVNIIEECGIENTTLKVNSLGCEDCRRKYRQTIKDHLADKKNELCEDCRIRLDKSNTLRILDCKKTSCREIVNRTTDDGFRELPFISEELCDSCRQYFNEYRERLKELRIKHVPDDRLVRGLDYYTGPVFELESNRVTLIAGGRYNNLVKQLGGPDVPACGWALGLERLESSAGANISENKIPEVYMALLNNGNREMMRQLARALREKGFSIEEDYEDISPGKKFKIADKKDVKWVLIFGEKEAEEKTVSIKNLESGDQESVDIENIDEIVRKIRC